MTTLRLGLFFSLIERYFLIAISLIGSMIIARLLTPEEIGIYSVSLAVIGIAQVVRDFGIGSFLIQEKNLTEAHIRTAFGFSLLIGSSLFTILYLAAPQIGQFYNDDRLVGTMQISVFNFLILPFCSISLSLLRRDMLFKRLAFIGVAASLAGFLTSVSCAYSGYGPNSMAIGAITSNSLTGMLAWLARNDRKLLLPSLSEWRPILKFGSQSSAASVVTTISMDINDLAVGRILGFAPVAMISRAQGLMNLFHRDIMGAIRGVMFPAFSKAHRNGEDIDTLYIKSVVTVTVFAWPFYGFAALYSHELIRLMFGPQWNLAAELTPIFCLAGAFAATCSLVLNAVIAVGRIDLATKAEFIIQPLRAMLIISAALLFETLMACAVAFLFAFVLMTPILYYVKDKCISTNYPALFNNILKSFKVTVSSLTLPAAILFATPHQSEPYGIALLLCAAGFIFVLSWFITLFYFKHPFRTEPLIQKLQNIL